MNFKAKCVQSLGPLANGLSCDFLPTAKQRAAKIGLVLQVKRPPSKCSFVSYLLTVVGHG